MYALCVSGAVNTQGFVWKFFFYTLYINFHSFIHYAQFTANSNRDLKRRKTAARMHDHDERDRKEDGKSGRFCFFVLTF